MLECWSPQYWVHSAVVSPLPVASNQMVVYMPGTTSFFTRNSGMKKLWMTSFDDISSLTGRPRGMRSSL